MMHWKLAFLLLLRNTFAESSPDSPDGDLMSFVTLPNVRALRYEVEHKNRKRVEPGYWFVTPYGQMIPENPTSRYEPYQIGPHIYDSDGILAWTGSQMFDNRNVFDFRAVHSMAGGPHLSLVWQHSWDGEDQGSGVILGNDYEIQKQLRYPPEFGAFDIHEFNVLNDGKTSLSVTYREHSVPLDSLGRPGEETMVLSGGFAEMDVQTGDVSYHWDSVDQVSLAESVRYDASSSVEGRPGWDYVHANSIDKNSNGDYIMSMRFTNTIYMVSGKDGHIMWRLRGTGASDFEQDFTFSKQHDAKFIESNGTRHVISFLNNASDEDSNDEDVSSVFIVELETSTTPMTARAIRRYVRPDGGLTRLRGNAQMLPNGNMFIGWSERGYFTEHAADGELLLSGRFASDRFSTYRSYKLKFTGRPNTPPDLVASVRGTDRDDLTTTIYVSWNGATDIMWWNIYAQASSDSHPVFIASVSKLDFETMHIAKGYLDWISAEAVDEHGNILGTSQIFRTEKPANWEAAGFNGNSRKLKPHDPAILYGLDGGEPTEHNPEEAKGSGDDDDRNEDGAYIGDAVGSLPTFSAHRIVDLVELSRIMHETYSTVSRIGDFLLFALAALLLGLACYGGYLLFWYWCRRRRGATYRHVPHTDDLPDEEVRLRSVS